MKTIEELNESARTLLATADRAAGEGRGDLALTVGTQALIAECAVEICERLDAILAAIEIKGTVSWEDLDPTPLPSTQSSPPQLPEEPR